jgi:hypothetical protein
MTIVEHWVATTRHGNRTLLVPHRAQRLWHQIRSAVPEALSFVIMPDHIHLVARPGAGDRLRRALTGFTSVFGVRFDLGPAERGTTAAIAGRMVRYGYLNPVRKGFCDDPYQWPWSTLRDIVEASIPIWTPRNRLCQTLGLDEDRLVPGLTAWNGRSFPEPRPTAVAAASLDGIRGAVRAVLRSGLPLDAPIGRLERQLVVQTAFAVGAPSVRVVADALRCTPRTIQRDRTRRLGGVEATILSLADARLRIGPHSLAPRSSVRSR